jgi:hypothetical protein
MTGSIHSYTFGLIEKGQESIQDGTLHVEHRRLRPTLKESKNAHSTKSIQDGGLRWFTGHGSC